MSTPDLPQIVVAEPLRPEIIERLKRVARVVELSDSSPESLVQAVGSADALLVRTRSHVTARIIEAAPKLRVIGRASPSLDHIDMRAAQRRSITVVYTPNVQVVSIAEYAVTLILTIARRVCWYDRKVRDGQFDALREPYGREVRNLSIGLLGGGAVAEESARILREGFHARLMTHAPEGVEALGGEATVVDLPGLLKQADVLSVHMPMHERFVNMIGPDQLAMMKPSACLVNTSRGTVVDNHALAEALKTRKLAGAALDVFDSEPLPNAHPLRNAPNCILSPHLAAATLDVAEGFSTVADDIIRVLNGEAPLYPASPRESAE